MLFCFVIIAITVNSVAISIDFVLWFGVSLCFLGLLGCLFVC